MKILGRRVYSVDLSPIVKNSIRVSVEQKDGDCKRKIEPYYECTENCDGLFMFADCIFSEENLSGEAYIWANALTKKRDYIDPSLFSFYGVESFEGLEKLYEELVKKGDRFKPEIIRKPGDIIYKINGEMVARKSECGLVNEEHVFEGEILETLEVIEINLHYFVNNSRKMTLEEKIQEISEVVLEKSVAWETIKYMFEEDQEFISAFEEHMRKIRKN